MCESNMYEFTIHCKDFMYTHLIGIHLFVTCLDITKTCLNQVTTFSLNKLRFIRPIGLTKNHRELFKCCLMNIPEHTQTLEVNFPPFIYRSVL